jgi:hypothetical protein
MVYFQNKNPIKNLLYFMDIWYMYFTAIWDILWILGIFCKLALFPVLVSCAKKNLATLDNTTPP